MKNEATKFFKEYFKVHEQDMEMYDDTIDCMVKFAEKVSNLDISKMPLADLRSKYQQLKEQFNAVHVEICKRENDVKAVFNKQLDNETDAAGNCFSDADRGL